MMTKDWMKIVDGLQIHAYWGDESESDEGIQSQNVYSLLDSVHEIFLSIKNFFFNRAVITLSFVLPLLFFKNQAFSRVITLYSFAYMAPYFIGVLRAFMNQNKAVYKKYFEALQLFERSPSFRTYSLLSKFQTDFRSFPVAYKSREPVPTSDSKRKNMILYTFVLVDIHYFDEIMCLNLGHFKNIGMNILTAIVKRDFKESFPNVDMELDNEFMFREVPKISDFSIPSENISGPKNLTSNQMNELIRLIGC
ncbi:hypothetical protein RF11_08046 [Thelohanellus kitauei]|uniref:Uncharacterized protein n=1 Tax=Thelohanellus kitauei TaxID=669202 RepID=A0A0C2MPC0_THEKT|nr:hypothetical protein RF11_08046 [Thelohanellus kitauei]